MSKPKTFAVTEREGGKWILFGPTSPDKIHSILFHDRRTWDAVNGWRPDKMSERGFLRLLKALKGDPNV